MAANPVFRSAVGLALTALLTVAPNTAATAATNGWVQQAKLVDGTAGAGGHFGVWSAIQGSTAAISAPDENVGSHFAQGNVYVFRQSTAGGWSEEAKLTAADGGSADSFGQSIGLSGSTLVVGSWGHDHRTGAAYVFQRSRLGTWSETAELVAPDGIAGDYFGWSVAISGRTVVVGAPFRDSRSGSAYVFTQAGNGGWSQQAELRPIDRDAGATFGLSVAIHGDTAAVGAPGWGSVGLREVGAAYVFRQGPGNRWSDVARLRPSNGRATDLFGTAIAVSDAYVAVGAPAHHPGGAGYVFTRQPGDSYAQQAILTPVNGGVFGYSIAALDGRVVVGSFSADQGKGVAYLFSKTAQGTWPRSARLVASDRTAGAYFGLSVAIDDFQIIVGADGIGPGAAYVFGRSG